MAKIGDHEVVMVIGQNMGILPDGRIVVRWRGGSDRPVIQVLPDIHTAERQAMHTIESYAGITVNDGASVRLEGEIETLRRIAGQTSNLAAGLVMGMAGLDSDQLNEVEASLAGLIGEMGAVRNPYKQAFCQALAEIYVNLKTKDQLSREEAARLAQQLFGALNFLLSRLGEVAGKTAGVNRRLFYLLEEEKEELQALFFAFGNLVGYYHKLTSGETLSREEKLKIAAEIAGPKALYPLMRLRANPYKERFDASEVQRLCRLPEYARDGRDGTVLRVIEGAIKKLRSAVLTEQDRVPPEKRWVRV